MFIGVLAAGPQRLEPLDAEVIITALLVVGIGSDIRIENSNGDTRRVHSAAPFGRRGTLETVPADLIAEAGQVVTGHFTSDFLGAACGWALP